ncbi:PKD domain-containing protein [Candidatus Poribacteria bacterium]
MKKSRFRAVLISVLLMAFGISSGVIAQVSITSITPNNGSVDGGYQVTIRGSGFFQFSLDGVITNPTVWFDNDWQAEYVIYDNSTQLRVGVPPHPQGRVDVAVINPIGGAGVLPNGFTYLDPPDVNAGKGQVSNEGDTVTVSATFTDNFGDTHKAVIDWGDGTITVGNIEYPPPLILLQVTIPTVTGSHVYRDNGRYRVTITVIDQFGARGSDSLIAGVSNVPPTIGPIPDQTITGANPTVSVNVQFTDPGSLDFHAMRVIWGDDSEPDIIEPAISPVTIQHTYPSDGIAYGVEVTVVDDDGGGDEEFFTVTNIAPALPEIEDVVLSEGSPTVLLDVTFTDFSPGDTHTVTIDWGDNSTPDVFSPVSSPVATQHTYPGDDGRYTANITVRDIEGIGSETSLTVFVVNEDPIIDPISNQILGECDPTFSISASFRDPGVLDTHTAVIDWGDGIREVGQVTEQVISGVLVGTVTGTHTYTNDDSINNVTVTITDDDKGSASEPFRLIVRNENPVIDDLADLIVSECDPIVNFEVNFSDCSPTDIHTATVNWGDGTQTEAELKELVVSGVTLGTIFGSHTYPKRSGVYTVTVTVNDEDNGSDSTSFTVTTENENPVIGSELPDLIISECDPMVSIQIDFTDCSPEGTYRVTIDWGDGTSPTTGIVRGTVVEDGISGTTIVNHLYARDDATGENAYTVTVTIQDDAGGSDSRSFTVTVENDGPVIEDELQDLTLTECDTTVNISADFANCGTRDTHIATIDWGDGTQTPGEVSESVFSGEISGTITGAHTYARDNGIYTVTVTVQDDDGAKHSRSLTVTVQNAAPVIDADLQNLTLTECDTTANLEAAFMDCGTVGSHTATIDWGDGTQTVGTVSETVVPEGVSGIVTGNHMYVQDDNVYNVTVTVVDDDGEGSSASLTVTVTNESPVILTGPEDLPFPECDPVVNVQMDFTDCGLLDTHTAVIDWDDGTQTPGTVSEAIVLDGVLGTVTGSHTYTRDVEAPGTYDIVVTVTDDNGGSSSRAFTAIVSDAGPIIETELVDLTLTECDPTVNLHADFTNCNPLDTHTATIDWGDDTQTAGTVSETIVSDAILGTVTGGHTYAKDDEIYTVVVTVEDDDGGSDSQSFTVTVENELLTIETPPQSLTISECEPTIDIQVDFSDCSTLDTHTALIDWGDDTQTSGAVSETVTPDGVSGTVTGSHTYTGDDGDYRVVVTVEDDDGGQRQRAFNVTVENAAPIIETELPSLAISECDPALSVQVDFSDCSLQDTHTATIDWGDGTQTPGSVSETVASNGVSGTAIGSHTYIDDNDVYTVTVTIEDDDGGSDSASFTVTVENEAPVIATSLQDQTLTECEPTIDVAVNFTSCGFQDTYTAVIDWGDGTQTPGTVNETVASDGVSGTVAGSHTYIDDNDVYTATVTVTDDDGGSDSESFTVTVENERPVILTNTQDLPFPECDPTVSVQMEFTDCSSPDTHTAVIDWGDGTQTAGTVNETSGTVTGSYVYTRGELTDPETYRIVVTVEDDDGGSSSRAFTAVVVDEGPMIETSLPDLTLTEDDTTVDLQFAFSDCNPQSTHTVVIGWGDNAEDTINSATNPLTINHTYPRDDGSYVVSVAVADDNGMQSEESFSVTIGNIAPVVNAGANQTLNANEPVVISGSFTDPGLLDTHTATINWGDSTTEAGQVNEVNGSGTVTGSHTYTSVGSYTVTITVADDDGGSGSDSITVDFELPPAVTSVSPNQVIDVGGTRVTIRGQNFQNGATVRIGNASATAVSFVSSTSITATTPSGPVGAVDVSVTNPDGQRGTLARGLTYTGIANITLSPQSAVVEVGNTRQFSVSGRDSVNNVYPIGNADVNWSVADTSVGSINSTGLFSATGFGSTTVTAILRSNSSIRDQASVEVPDTEPPEVLSDELFPDFQDEDVPVTSGISIFFSEAIDVGTVADGIEVTGEDDRDIVGQFSFDAANGSLLFTPAEPLKDGETVTVLITTAVEDLAGNGLQRAFRRTFSTGISVWAGDANNDRVVDVRDIIPLGQYWRSRGPSRDEASAEWELQTVVAWSDEAATYADTNGDGVVNEEDILPIAANWQLRHPLNQLAPPQISSDISVPDDPKMLSIYEAMYEVLETASFENDGVRSLKSTLRDLVVNINRQALPHETMLLQNFPNPFNPETWIPYQLAEDAFVRIRIYNVNGTLVRTLNIGQSSAGYYLSKENAVYWDGKNNAGEQVSSGIYFSHLQAGHSEGIIKLIITR